MKKILFLLLISIGVFGQTVHRVTNGMDLQTVIDNAVNGDVILVESGEYGDVLLNKTLILFGTGYFVNETPSSGSAILNSINVTASGSQISGFKITQSIYVSSNNVLIARNYTEEDILVGLDKNTNTWVTNSDNCIIKQNYFRRIRIQNSPEISHILGIQVSNNIATQGFTISSYHTGISGEIKNNTFNCDNSPSVDGNGFGYVELFDTFKDGENGQVNLTFKNNIITHVAGLQAYRPWSSITYYTPEIFKNNIIGAGYGTLFPNNIIPPSNTLINDLTTLYQGFPNNPNSFTLDARNQLAPNSPAKGAGENGTDCGAFGGDDPYVLSGIPSIPSIYQLTVPSQVPQNGTLNIQIKAKTNN